MSSWLLAAGGAIAALFLAFIQGRLSGARAQRNANRAQDAAAYETHLQEISDAARARNAVPPGGVPDDKYRRD